MMDLAIETRGLAKAYLGDRFVLRELNLHVRRGTVYGLIGRNGEGKTTTLRLLMGLLRPTQGEALVLGNDLWRAPPAQRQRVAYVSQEGRLPTWMALGELAAYFARLYSAWDGTRARHLAGAFGVSWERPLSHISGGEVRKAAILLALAARPEVLILDEPAAGLDPVARRELADALVEALQQSDGLTVLLSTHILADVERLAEDVGILAEGKLQDQGPLGDLQGSTRRVQVIFDGDAVPPSFAWPGAVRSEVAGSIYTGVVRGFREEDAAAVREKHPARVQVFPLGLEELFIEIRGPARSERRDKDCAGVGSWKESRKT